MNYKKLLITSLLAAAISACSQNDDHYIGGSIMGGESALSSFYPAPPAQWMGGSDPYYAAGYTGDIMPYFDNGTFHIYFLHDAANKPAGKGFHDIHEFTSTDLANFNYTGQMIPYGNQDEADFALGTGSVVKAGNTYYFYYTGHNEIAAFMANNARENVLLATSTDLKNWAKVPSFKLTAPAGYYNFDFRDPNVFYNEEAGKYWMLVSTQTDPARKAVLLLFTTDDPATGNWVPQGPLYATTPEDSYLMMECSDIFKMGNYWYMTFSEDWSADSGTHYRMANSINGPWVKPANDKLDGQYYYAAKTASDGNKRYAFGWTAHKAPENDTGGKEWAGNMVIHELVQNGDGTLAVKAPDALEDLLSQNVATAMQTSVGTVTQNGTSYLLDGSAATATATFAAPGKKVKIKAQVTLGSATGSAGFFFNLDDTGTNYKIVFEPGQGRIAGYNSANELVTQIPFALQSGTAYATEIIADGSTVVLYVNGKTALSHRVYGRDTQKWGLTATGAGVTISGLEVSKPQN